VKDVSAGLKLQGQSSSFSILRPRKRSSLILLLELGKMVNAGVLETTIGHFILYGSLEERLLFFQTNQ
jgi:hypothetical protein